MPVVVQVVMAAALEVVVVAMVLRAHQMRADKMVPVLQQHARLL